MNIQTKVPKVYYKLSHISRKILIKEIRLAQSDDEYCCQTFLRNNKKISKIDSLYDLLMRTFVWEFSIVGKDFYRRLFYSLEGKEFVFEVLIFILDKIFKDVYYKNIKPELITLSEMDYLIERYKKEFKLCSSIG